jgi:hypothetical protein
VLYYCTIPLGETNDPSLVKRVSTLLTAGYLRLGIA